MHISVSNAYYLQLNTAMLIISHAANSHRQECILRDYNGDSVCMYTVCMYV